MTSPHALTYTEMRRTAPGFAPRFCWGWLAAAVLLVAVAYGMANVQDIRAAMFPPAALPSEDLAQAVHAWPQDAYLAGLEAGRAEALPQVRLAFQEGLNTGVNAAAATPRGLALVQACRAMSPTAKAQP